jgi:hypothetical protein
MEGTRRISLSEGEAQGGNGPVGYGEGELDLGRWRGQKEGNRESDKKGKGIKDRDLTGDARTLRLDTTLRVGKSGSLKEDREGQGLGRESSGVQ